MEEAAATGDIGSAEAAILSVHQFEGLRDAIAAQCQLIALACAIDQAR